MFVRDHLLKIKDLSKSNVSVQNACSATLDFLKKHLTGKETRRPYKEPLQLSFDKSPFVASKDLVEQEWDFVVDTLLETFQVACSSSNPRVIENALEALLTLVEKNMILGPVRSGKIGDLLAKSYEVKDDSVHMSILLTFGMLVAKPACELHDANLMTAIRISYNIFLITANTGIQKMAKEKLTDILRTLFQRLDGGHHTATTGSHSRTTTLITANDSSSRPNTPLRIPPSSRVSDAKVSPIKPETPTHASTSASNTNTESSATNSDEDEPNSLNSQDGPSVPASPDDKNGEPKTEDESQKEALSPTTFDLDDAGGASSAPTPSSSNRAAADDIALKDCLQAFRGLCKLSVKAMPEVQASNIHSFDIRSRILCLELLNAIFEEDNLNTFRNNTRFINLAIKKQLMDTIYVNIPSQISLVFRLTLSICVVLIKEFRDSMKSEVEGILSCVLLPILESPNAPSQYRLAVSRALYVIYKSPQCLTDLFLNYDCDLNGKNIFEILTKTIAKTSQRKLPDNLTPEVYDQEMLIKHLALKTSVCVTIALVEWSKTLYEHPADQKARREALKLSSGVPNSPSAPSSSQSSETQIVPTLVLSSSTNTAGGDMEDFFKLKEYKNDLDEGKELFKDSFKKGLRHFWSTGMCEKTSPGIAKFLFSTPGLDKTMVGEYLAERYDFDGHSPTATLKEYLELFHFKGLEIDLALRIYLGAFRMPGEGQKVSRIMEAFAKKYFEDTQETELFGNEDAVYYLAMAITVLTTSLHNPSVPLSDRLTLVTWKRLLIGQNDEKDYDDPMIDGIFGRIAAEEFKVLGADPPAPPTQPTTAPNDKQKAQLFLQEAKLMSEQTKELVKERYAAAQNYLREARAAAASTPPTPATVPGADSATPLTTVDAAFLSSSLAASMDVTSSSVISSFTSAPTPDSHPLKFKKSTSPAIARLMFSATGLSLLSTYQTSFETTNDLKTVAMSLEGVRGGIRLSCLFTLKLERDAFISTLAQLTLLESVPVKEMKMKHLEAIRALLTVTEEEGNLGDCWKRILSCISPFERLLSLTPQANKPSGNSNAASATNGDDDSSHIDEMNASLLTQSKFLPIFIDRIFTNSSRLSDEGITDFVVALCQVSKAELLAPALMNQTRTFSLQKLVEVADFNISRPKYVWMTMWTSVATHFIEAGLHRAEHVALLAVDSLRQVASKLIERHTKEYQEGREFQMALLSPFEAMYASPSPNIRDYLICCLAKLMATHFESVHSGWPAILAVINKASNDTPNLVALGFHQLESISTQVGYFNSLVTAEHFPSYVDSISKYADNPHITEKVASQAINLLKFAAAKLASGSLPLPSILVSIESEIAPADVEIHAPADEAALGVLFTARPAHRGQWLPILRGLTQTLEAHDINVRPLALAALFDILGTHGKLFSKRLFRTVFTEILFPVFERVMRPASTQLVIDDTEWLLTTCHKFLHGTVVLFSKFFDVLGNLLLADFLDLLSRLTLQNNEKLATFGITCLETLLTSTLKQYTPQMWSNVISSTALILKQNMPPRLRVNAPVAPSEPHAETTNATVTEKDPAATAPQATPSAAAANAKAPPIGRANVIRQSTAASLGRSTSARRSDPRKKILLGKAWIQNSALKMVRECLIDGSTPNETINLLEPHFVAQILDIYKDSFMYAYGVLRDPKLEEATEQSLYDLILKQEIDSMWTYTEVVFALYNEHPKGDEVSKLVEERILNTFAVLEQCHMVLAQQAATLSERSRRLHESNEALVIAFLSNITSFQDDVFLDFLSRIYPSFIRLTLSDSVKVRETVRDVLGRLGAIKLGISPTALLAASVPAVDIVVPSDEPIFSPTTSPKISPRGSRRAMAATTSNVESAPEDSAANSKNEKNAALETSAVISQAASAPAIETSRSTETSSADPSPSQATEATAAPEISSNDTQPVSSDVPETSSAEQSEETGASTPSEPAPSGEASDPHSASETVEESA